MGLSMQEYWHELPFPSPNGEVRANKGVTRSGVNVPAVQIGTV